MNTIYAIREVCNKSVIYIGYSTNFNRRKREHKYNCLNPKSKRHHFPIYKHIRENGGYDKFEFVVLEQSNDNIKFKECEYTAKYGLNNLLNVAGGNTGLSVKEYKKIYHEKNKERDNEKSRAYRLANKEQIKENKKAHYLAKKEEINEYYKEYYQANKEQINENAKEKFNCECGSIISKGAKYNHFRSKKHLSYINNFKTT
jgi:hypothetical protein